MDKIVNELDYKTVMTRIESIMAKGSDNATQEELAEIRDLALAAQDYEQQTKIGYDFSK